MKKISLLVLALFTTGFVMAQSENYSYVFPTFEKGVVHLKTGDRIECYLNYETTLEQMVYVASNKNIIAVNNTGNINYVSIGSRIFEPKESNSFYEKVDAGNGEFFVRWRDRKIMLGARGPYGSHYPESPRNNTITNYTGSNSIYGISGIADRIIYEDCIINPQNSLLYVGEDGRLSQFNSAKSFLKIFDNEEEQALFKTYMKKEKTDFKNLRDVQKLIWFANQVKAQI